jgi:hypothetical protein
MANVLIVSGAAAYADPWHPFAQTSARLADIVAASGHAVSISEKVEPALADLRGVDVAVVNIGCPRPDRPAEALVPVAVGLTAHLTRGGGLLGVHVSSTSLTTMPTWPAVLGGRWVRGTSMHPPQDVAHVYLTSAPHPILIDLTDFDVLDERYSYLELEPDVVLCLVSTSTTTDGATPFFGPTTTSAVESSTTRSATTCGRTTARAT